jgi:hypothetical protein
VSKQLLIDLSETPDVRTRVPGRENFEGLAFLTATSRRHRVLLVSDDSFSPRQRTWFVSVLSREDRRATSKAQTLTGTIRGGWQFTKGMCASGLVSGATATRMATRRFSR